ncbi:FG-GAP-like repeat-containing protein [Catellatospora bangladeshensis]|uniref:Peptidase S1 domain-containing protein n=1 Tax=Catellatospora bangladeshensis TaxID=310355 RepID=A0A8J3JBW9_9ACTN|nr:FG-GAP-like repeat-containing protein [Catellatospora bangladeshensis]GIF82022.1 hypothetical protein Cba03nite_33710 [Catellatospora bangladeshensis]
MHHIHPPTTRRRPLATRLAAALVAALSALALPALTPTPAAAIDGGYLVTTNEFAYVAEIRNTVAGGLCTGSLIHPSWVLTAVHCSVPTSVGDMTVRVGNIYAGSGGQVRRISRILRHPDYTGGHNDVALLELATPITNITPVRLADPAYAYLWDGYQGGPFTQYDQGIATGWGRDVNGQLATQLKYVGVFITPSRLDNLGIKRIMVDRGPCPGDSGGPLLVNLNSTLVQVGVFKGGVCGGESSYSEIGAGTNRTWLNSQLTAVPYTPFGLADWDRDGHQDLIARHTPSGDLWLYPGESRRGYSYATPVRIGIGYNGYSFFGSADWDRDGHQDLIVRHDATGDLWLHPGESRRGGSYATPVRIGNGYQGFTAFGATDWDRDGHQDLIARNDTTGDLWLYPGESRRGYSTATPVRIGNGWNSYTSFDLADWDRDGHQDILARDNDSGHVYIYPGDSRRGYSSAARVLMRSGYSGYTPFGVGDWDRDGHQDLITRKDATGDLYLHPGESRRDYSYASLVRIGNGW